MLEDNDKCRVLAFFQNLDVMFDVSIVSEEKPPKLEILGIGPSRPIIFYLRFWQNVLFLLSKVQLAENYGRSKCG